MMMMMMIMIMIMIMIISICPSNFKMIFACIYMYIHDERDTVNDNFQYK
jgi:hypothetical protein